MRVTYYDGGGTGGANGATSAGDGLKELTSKTAHIVPFFLCFGGLADILFGDQNGSLAKPGKCPPLVGTN